MVCARVCVRGCGIVHGSVGNRMGVWCSACEGYVVHDNVILCMGMLCSARECGMMHGSIVWCMVV